MNQSHYSIRQVIDLTGVSEFILRTWELRYGAIKPKRTKTGRRVYTSEDVLKIRLLTDLTKLGKKISHIAALSSNDLERVFNSAENAHEYDKNLTIAKPSTFSQKLQKLVIQFKWDQVQNLLEYKKGSPLKHLKEVIIPAVILMNQMVDQSLVSISHEHILSALIKESLACLKNEKSVKKHDQRFIFATPEGDYHDLGILIAAKLCQLAGVRTLILGSNMPKRDLAESCLKFKATHLVVSSSISRKEGAKDDWLNYLNFLDKNLSSKIEIWSAGRNAAMYNVQLKRKYKFFSTFIDFEMELTNA